MRDRRHTQPTPRPARWRLQTRIQPGRSVKLSGVAARLDFTLRPAGVTTELTAVGGRDAPLLCTTRTVAGGSLTREELERLPSFSRSPLDSVFLLGGVTEEPLTILYP